MIVSVKAEAKLLPTQWSEASSLSSFLAEQSLFPFISHSMPHKLATNLPHKLCTADAVALPKVHTGAVVL